MKPVLRRGLSSKAHDRFPSMSALLEALAEATDHDSVPKRRHRTKGMRSWRWRVAGAAMGMLVAALGSLFQSSDPEVEPLQETVAPTVDTIARSVEDDASVESPEADQTVHARSVRRHRIHLRAAQS